MAGWANWIAIVSVIPIEAEASVQYMSSWPWHWAHALYRGTQIDDAWVAICGCACIGVLFHQLLDTGTVFTRQYPDYGFQIGDSSADGDWTFCAGFHPGNFSNFGGFAPNGWSSVLTAIATSGVIFAFNGFQSPVNLAGEAKNPNKTVPRAVLGSILIAGVIYVLLQMAFIGAVKPGMVSMVGAASN